MLTSNYTAPPMYNIIPLNLRFLPRTTMQLRIIYASSLHNDSEFYYATLCDNLTMTRILILLH